MWGNNYVFIKIFFVHDSYLASSFSTDRLVPSGHQVAATTIGYLAGAAIMFFLFQTNRTAIVWTQKNQSLSDSYLQLTGIVAAILLQKSSHLYRILFRRSQRFAKYRKHHCHRGAKPTLLAAMVGGPIMEEFVFRRALVGIIGKYSNVWVGVVVSAVAFALPTMTIIS